LLTSTLLQADTLHVAEPAKQLTHKHAGRSRIGVSDRRGLGVVVTAARLVVLYDWEDSAESDGDESEGGGDGDGDAKPAETSSGSADGTDSD
jgi:hypothetical protein